MPRTTISAAMEAPMLLISLLVLMGVTATTSLVAGQNVTTNLTTTPPTAAPVLVDNNFVGAGIASPARTASFYVLPANARYSPGALPGTIYLFRQTASVDGAVVANQRPIITRFSGDLRQVAIVVVPSGSMTTEFITETQILSSGLQIAVQGQLFCNCPLREADFVYATTAHETQYPTHEVFFSNGTLTRVLDFGYVTNATKTGVLYQQVDLLGNTLAYMVDSVPGDAEYAPMRRLYTVTVAAAVTSVSALSGLVLSDAGTYYNVPVTGVLGADESAEVFQLTTGYYRGRTVEYYHFNESRLTTGVAQRTRVMFSRMYVFASSLQTVPVVDVVPGDETYSDLWMIVEVTVDAATASNVTFPVQTYADIPASWTRTATGRYINCPVVNVNSSLSNPLHAPKVPVFYRGDTRYCFNFSYAPGCALKPAYTLQRSGDQSFVDGNELFTVSPSTDESYTPMAYVMPFGVDQQYRTGVFTSAAGLLSPPSIDDSSVTGTFANRPIVNEHNTLRAASSYVHSLRIVSDDRLREVSLRWSVNDTLLDVQVECTMCDGYAAVGFGGATSHAGLFVAGFIDATGTTCVRQLEGDGESRTQLREHTADALSVTRTIVARRDSATVFQFSRAITVTDSSYTAYSLGTGIDERMTVITRSRRLTGCLTVLPNALGHDFVHVSPSHVWVTNTSTSSGITFTTVAAVAPTTAAASITTTAAAVIQPESNASWTGVGQYRCDGSMSFGWTIDFNASTITVVITLPGQFTGWAGIGLGEQMAGADMITVFRDPFGRVEAQDRKGIQQALPQLDERNDVTLVDSAATASATVFTLRRPLVTGDTSTSAQPRSRTTLVSSSLTHELGWAHGVRIAYYDLGNGPAFGSVNATATNTLYVFVQQTNGSYVSHSFQNSIADKVPGQAGYSDLWDITYIEVPSGFTGPELKAVHEIPATWTRPVSTGLTARINCVMVHLGTSLDITLPSRTIWYRGSVQKCLEFPSQYAQTTRTQRMLSLISNVTNVTLDVIFDSTPLDTATFTPFVMRYHARVPADYIIGSWTNIETFLEFSGFNVTELGMHANVPVVNLNNVSASLAPGPSQTAALDVVDPDVIAFYDHTQVLHSSEEAKTVTLYWKYDFNTELLYTMIIASQSRGYVAVGFSNSSYTQMEEADIVLAYIDSATGVPCIRTMYSRFTVGAPSAPPTMFIRNPSVQYAGGSVILRFERTFDANAHGAGRIPTPAQGATSRVIYATLPTAIGLNCSAGSFTGLYHGTNPHGSVEVNWLGSTSAPGAVTPAPTTATAGVLTRVDLRRLPLYYRSSVVPVYCAPDYLTSFDGVRVSTPNMYIVVDESGMQMQSPVVTSTVGFTSYTGIWRVVYAVVPSNWTSASSEAELLYAATRATRTYTNATAYMNCPVVHAGSTVEVQDQAAYPRQSVFFGGQLVACFNWGTFTDVPRVGMMWNGTSQTAAVIDSLRSPLRREQTIVSTVAQTSAEGASAQPTTSTPTLRNCIAVASAIPDALRGVITTPDSRAYELQNGFFNGRRVTYFRHQASTRFANEFEVDVGMIYVVKLGSSVTAPDAQVNWIGSVSTGNGTYSDIWRVVIVDASGVAPSSGVTDFRSSADVASLPQTVTDLHFNCPVVSGSSSFGTSSASVTLRSIFVNGVAVSCAQFGFTPKIPTALPRVYDLYTSSGSPVSDGTLFSAVPGTSDFFPVHWVVRTTLTLSVPSGLTSVGSLNSTLTTSRVTYTAWNIFVVSVATGERDVALKTVTSVDNELRRSTQDYTALMASPVTSNLTVAAGAPVVPPTSTIYLFRRGLTIDSVEVGYQAPILSKAPGEVQYTATGGSTGYSDLHTVIIIEVPSNATAVVITNEVQLQLRITSGTYRANLSTGLQMTYFAAVNTTTGLSMTCPTQTAWSNDQAVSGLNCGLTATSSGAILDTNGTVGPVTNYLRSRDEAGVSMFVGVPLVSSNGNLIQDFGTSQRTAYADGTPAILHELEPLQMTTMANVRRSAKYVFRFGPSLYGSDPVAVPPVVEPLEVRDGNPVFGNVFDLHVVNVAAGSATFTVASMPAAIASKAELLALVEENCWGIEPTGVTEIGRVLLFQNTLDAVDGVTTETVISRGGTYRQVTSTTTSNALALSTTNYAIAVYDNATRMFSHYILPVTTLAAAQAAPLRRVLHLYSTAPASDRSITDSTVAAAVDSGGVALLHVSFVSRQTYVAKPTRRSFTRSTGYYDGRGVQYYDVGIATSLAAASAPVPIYFLRVVNSRGGVVSASGMPVLSLLPGHDSYSDLHTVHYCTIPETATLTTPTSEGDILAALANGTITACAADHVRNMPVVHAESTVESRDLYDGVLNPNGVRLVDVVFDKERFRVFDFGRVTSTFDPVRDTVAMMRIQATDALVANPAVFSTAELTGEPTLQYSPLKRGVETYVDAAYVSGTVSTFAAVPSVAIAQVESVNVYNLPVVAMDSVLPSILYDDRDIIPDAMSVVWAHGPLTTSPPYELRKHDSRGIAQVNFYTGFTNQQTNPPVATLGDRSIRFGESFTMSWALRAPVGRRQGTYRATETDLVITLSTARDQWIAIGFSSSGRMPGSTIYMAYLSDTLNSVGQVLAPHLTERYAFGYAEPSIDPSPIIRLESFRLNAGGTGYDVTFSRPLVPTNTSKVVIGDGPLNIIWAQGDWDRSTMAPRRHTVRGSAQVNLIDGRYVEVPERTVSFWYIAVLVVAIVFALFLGLLLRAIEPGMLLFYRPLSRAASSATSVFGAMVLGQILLFLLMLVVTVCWLVGNALDMDDSRIPDPWWRAVGSAAQLVFCFMFLPLPRNNLVLWLLGTTFHKARRWLYILGFLCLLLAWVHGVAMLIVGPNDTGKIEWWGGVIGMLGLTVYMGLQVAPIPPRTAYYAQWLLFLVVVVFVCLHRPITAAGLIPTFLALLVDWALRFKDRQTRWGAVRSYATPMRQAVAIELTVRSPWHGCCTRPFTARAGAFVFGLMEGWAHPVPLVVSSRITQEEGESTATLTTHIRGSVQDTIQAQNAPRITPNGESAADNVADGCANFQQFVLRCANTRNLGNRVVYYEGPYAGCRLNLKYYRTVLAIAGGSGMASSMALLDSLVRDPEYFRRSSVLAVKLLWVVRDPEDLLTFADDLHGLISGALPLNLQLYLFVTRSNNPITAQFGQGGRQGSTRPYDDDDVAAAGDGEHGEDVAAEQDTSGDSHEPTEHSAAEGSSTEPAAGDDSGNLPARFSPAQSRPKKRAAKPKPGELREQQTRELALTLPKHPLFDVVQVFYGRPVFTHFFAEQRTAALRKGESVVGVHVSAPPAMAGTVMQTADAVTEWRTFQYHLDIERYDTMFSE